MPVKISSNFLSTSLSSFFVPLLVCIPVLSVASSLVGRVTATRHRIAAVHFEDGLGAMRAEAAILLFPGFVRF